MGPGHPGQQGRWLLPDVDTDSAADSWTCTGAGGRAVHDVPAGCRLRSFSEHPLSGCPKAIGMLDTMAGAKVVFQLCEEKTDAVAEVLRAAYRSWCARAPRLRNDRRA